MLNLTPRSSVSSVSEDTQKQNNSTINTYSHSICISIHKHTSTNCHNCIYICKYTHVNNKKQSTAEETTLTDFGADSKGPSASSSSGGKSFVFTTTAPPFLASASRDAQQPKVLKSQVISSHKVRSTQSSTLRGFFLGFIDIYWVYYSIHQYTPTWDDLNRPHIFHTTLNHHGTTDIGRLQSQ